MDFTSLPRHPEQPSDAPGPSRTPARRLPSQMLFVAGMMVFALGLWLHGQVTSPRLDWIKSQRFCRRGFMEWEVRDRLDKRGIPYDRSPEPHGWTRLYVPLDGSMSGKRLRMLFREGGRLREMTVVNGAGNPSGD